MSLLIIKGVPSQRMINLLWAYLTFIFMVWIRLLWRNFQEMIEEQREESEVGNAMLGCCATVSCRRMHPTSLISLSSAELSMMKVFKAKQTAQTARLQSPKVCNFQTSMFKSGFARKQERRSGRQNWWDSAFLALVGLFFEHLQKHSLTLLFLCCICSFTAETYPIAVIWAALLRVTLW